MKQNKEIWKDVPGYEGYYQVSNEGRVRSLDRWVIYKNGRERFYKGKFFEGSFNNRGYKKLSLSKDGKAEYFFIHQVVAMAFLDHEPNGNTLVIDHINGDKADNRAENLQIVTHRDNTSTCHRSDRNSLSSDFAGVNYYKQIDRWRAKIYYNETHIHLGYYNDEEDASNAYQKALGELENGTFKIEDYKASFTSKFKGITFHKASQKWRAQPTINGKQTYLGLFTSEEEAHQAVLELNL